MLNVGMGAMLTEEEFLLGADRDGPRELLAACVAYLRVWGVFFQCEWVNRLWSMNGLVIGVYQWLLML